MYGIVNQAIQGLVQENFGNESWEKIKAKAGIEVQSFLNNQSYDDSITYQLAGAAAEVLEMEVGQVLHAFGEYWILKTGLNNYGALLKSGGNNLKEFLVNLPNFHSRIMLMYPNLTPPEFKIDEIEDNSVHVHYFSERAGLTDFMSGLLSGLGKMFETDVEVTLIEAKDQGNDHDVFKVVW